MGILLALSLVYGSTKIIVSDKPIKEKAKDEVVMVAEEVGTTTANSIVPFSGTVCKFARKEKRMKVWNAVGLYKNND